MHGLGCWMKWQVEVATHAANEDGRPWLSMDVLAEPPGRLLKGFRYLHGLPGDKPGGNAGLLLLTR